jgi:hypothetical protein
MRTAFWALDKILGQRIARQTQHHLARVANTPIRASRDRAVALLERLAADQGPHVLLGETDWKQPVRLPLGPLVKGHATISGSSGAGKSMAALLMIDAILQQPPLNLSFGVIDPKQELFERCLFLIARRLQELPPDVAERLKERIIIIDLSSQDPVTSYNIASPWAGSDLDFFAQSRFDTLQEILPSGDGLSLRGGGIVKHVIKLLADLRLPFSYFDRVLSSEQFRSELLARSADEDLKRYFRAHFPKESGATVAAVRARIASALLSSPSIKLALSGREAPDFRRFQDEHFIVLINTGGPHIPRSTARTLQALLLSDVRQAVFARTTQTPFLWICDEAQNFFRTRQLRENMADLLTMSRSFGSFFLCLTQNLSTAVQDGEILETFHTNTRWSLSMRGTPRDVGFLEPALPVTGRLQKPHLSPYAAPEFYRPSEERALQLNRIRSLPDRVGWLWLKSLTGEALRVRTRTLTLPEGHAFQETVGSLRDDARIGRRISRSSYLAEIAQREAEFMACEPTDKVELLKKAYQEVGEGGL